MQYVCVPWYAPRDLVQLQLVLLMDSFSVYTLLYQCTFEKAIQMNICQQKDWMTGKQSYDICSKEKNCKQKKMQLKKVNLPYRALLQKHFAMCGVQKKMSHSKQNIENRYIVRNERASLWTTLLSDTQRNAKALNSYMAFLPKQENISIHNHQQAQLSWSEIQWWSVSMGGYDDPLNFLAHPSWNDLVLNLILVVSYSSMLYATCHNTHWTSTSSETLFWQHGPFNLLGWSLFANHFSSLKATERFRVCGEMSCIFTILTIITKWLTSCICREFTCHYFHSCLYYL